MNLSPQSADVIRKLRSGQHVKSGQLAVGPLDQETLQLLDVLVDEFEDLSGRKGEDQARELRRHYSEQMKARSTSAVLPRAATPPSGDSADVGTRDDYASAPVTTTPPRWKLISLRCQSIRGIAPPGEEFEFEFHGESNLIFGPNGSGKSSILSAVVWALTGKLITDSELPDTEAPMYRAPGATRAGSKLRDWPVVATLPSDEHAELATPDCWVEVRLRCPHDERDLCLRRSIETGLELSEGGVHQSGRRTLNDVGIGPLDLQLSLLAPTVFGRRSVEGAENARSLLTMMLGFDDLEQLGDLASKVAGNRTRLAKKEKADVDRSADELKREVAQLAELLPTSTPVGRMLHGLAKQAELSAEDILEATKDVGAAIATAEAELAMVLGLEVEEGKPPAGLADKLTVAIASLEKGIGESFPSLDRLRLENALPPTEASTAEDRLASLKTRLESFTNDARASIASRFDWWRKENASGSKVSLLLNAAQYYDDATEKCPVCQRPIKDRNLKEELVALKCQAPGMRTELRTFFSDLSNELSKIIPQALSSIGKAPVLQAIESDWDTIQSRVLGATFAGLAADYDTKVRQTLQELQVAEIEEPSLLPEDVDDGFRSAGTGFLEAVACARRSLSYIDWGVGAIEQVTSDLDEIVTSDNEGEAPSLRTLLSRGKDSAEVVKPLKSVELALSQGEKKRKSIKSARKQLQQLESLAVPLDHLKKLSKYAESEVRTTFESIRDATTTNLKRLYEETATGLEFSGLRLGKGRDKSVEARLLMGTYEVPGQFYANAGLQRAVALSFYFALLDRHLGGLGFILMDDPILSLDEDHRERWSDRILRPKLADFQVILATHQRQYLNNCRNDFSADRVVELNPRDRTQRVSWHPGDRLRRAEEQLETDWMTAATTMRKFREDVLISLDAYSPAPFFNRDNLSSSLAYYKKLGVPNPLAGKSQRKIVQFFESSSVTTVLDPGSHSPTEQDVTKSMARDCLDALKNCQKIVDRELERLERLRRRALRDSVIPASLIAFDSLPNNVSWNNPVKLRLIGAAAAKSDPWVVDLPNEGRTLSLMPGAVVLVSGDTLDPVAKSGQWVVLAPEAILPKDADLVAARDANGNRYLRRIWSDKEKWVLQSVNPVCPMPSVSVDKREAAIRRIIGVLYEPFTSVLQPSDGTSEWLPQTSINVSQIAEYHAIEVEGDSLNPLAWRGQKVLVERQVEGLESVSEGTLAVVQTATESIGNVIKRVFPGRDHWILVSPNPVETITPDLLRAAEILAISPVRGILFDMAEVVIE